MHSGSAALYEYLKKLRGQKFGLTVSLLEGGIKTKIIDAGTPVVTTGINWIVEPSHLFYNNGETEVLLPLANVIGVARSIEEQQVELLVQAPTG